MQPTTIRFVSGNKFKLDEAQAILAPADVTVLPLHLKINELQTDDTEVLVRDKTLKAFRRVGRPLFVEHTGLYINQLGGLPGGLTQIFWDTLRAERFCELFGQGPDPSVVARTVICYTDSRRLHHFHGEISGRIAREPSGPEEFQWDCIFVPDGHEKTFAELGDHKNEISMRRRSLDAFMQFLKGIPPDA